jgi:dihydropteroate synthase
MGILNVTDNSFYDGGKHVTEKEWLTHTAKMLDEGADIIDIGVTSSKPGSKLSDKEDELKSIRKVLSSLVKEFPKAILSADTYWSSTAKVAVAEGAHIINDISAGDIDSEMFSTIAELNVPYIIMHMQGTPETMQIDPLYKDVSKEVIFYLSEKVNKLKMLGIRDIMIDPGFGFGKTLEQNYKLLNDLELFKFFELPILVGLSRKSMICKALDVTPDEALNGTIALNMLALNKGAGILRVHDVKEAKEVIKIFENLKMC